MFICWFYCYSIKSNAFAMVVDVVGAHDGGELIIHGVANLLADRTFSNIVSNKALGNLMAWELFAESKVSSSITEVTESRAELMSSLAIMAMEFLGAESVAGSDNGAGLAY